MRRLILTSMLCCAQVAFSQLRVSGQASAGFVKANNGYSQYSFNAGRGSFVWRWDLFADAPVSDHLTFLSNFRMLQDQIPHIDLFALRMSDIASSGVSVQIGQIDIPFGNLGERRFPKENPFFGLPLMNEHVTSLCASDYDLWIFFPSYAIAGDGVCLLDQGLYDLGVKAYGSVGIFDFAAVLINGMVSTTGTYSPQGLNSNGGYGKIFRLAATPFTGLTLGASYAYGPFMKNESDDSSSALFLRSADDYPQQAIAGDVDFSIEHFSLYGIALINSWKYVHNLDLKAFSYSVETRYALTPRITVAVRGGGVNFGTINATVLNTRYIPSPYSGKWDHDLFRLEGAVGYRLDRQLLLKVCYQINKTYGVPVDPVDNVLAVQTVLSF